MGMAWAGSKDEGAYADSQEDNHKRGCFSAFLMFVLPLAAAGIWYIL